MRSSQSQLVQKTLEYERIDAALAAARMRVQALEAEYAEDEPTLAQARAAATALSYKRAAVREQLEAIEKNIAD